MFNKRMLFICLIMVVVSFSSACSKKENQVTGQISKEKMAVTSDPPVINSPTVVPNTTVLKMQE